MCAPWARAAWFGVARQAPIRRELLRLNRTAQAFSLAPVCGLPYLPPCKTLRCSRRFSRKHEPSPGVFSVRKGSRLKLVKRLELRSPAALSAPSESPDLDRPLPQPYPNGSQAAAAFLTSLQRSLTRSPVSGGICAVAWITHQSVTHDRISRLEGA